MANINRDYLIVLDAKSSVISEADELKYYITDEHSQNLFVNLVVRDIERINKYVEVHDPEKYELELHIVKPNNDIVRPHLQANLLSVDDALYAFELPKEATDYIGTYKCELRVTYKETEETTVTTSNKFKYKVKRSIYNNLDAIQDAPQYPIVIQLFDKLSDINQYEEDRRANELARQLAEEQRQARFNALDSDMVDRITAMDDKMVDVENRVSTKEQAVDKLITDTKADIDEYKVAKDQEIDEYKATKDTEINNAITAQDNKINTAITAQNNTITQAISNQDTKIDTAITAQNDRITVVENNDAAQNNKLDTLQNKATIHEERITTVEAKNTEQDNRLDVAENRLANIGNDITNTMQPIIDEHTSRLDAIEAIDVAQNTRLDAIEVKNQQQDDRLLDIEKVNKRQDIDLKCLFTEAKNNMMNITEEGNSIYLQNSTEGHVFIDEIKGNTLVNCNKEPDKELILNGNINTSGDNTVTITEGVDGGLVDVALEGNTLVNVSKTKDTTAITKAYTVENSGNHIALQGDYDGKCKPIITGNTLWIDNDTEEILTAFDEGKSLRLQSTFEDNLVTQEMVDSGEEEAGNLGKYKVEYKVTGKNKFDLNNLTSFSIQSNNGMTVSIENDKLYIEGTATGTYDFRPVSSQYNKVLFEIIKKAPVGTSFTLSNNMGGTNYWRVIRNGTTQYIVDTITKQQRDGDIDAFIRITKDTSISKSEFNIQIEEGDVSTAYEPYKRYTKTLYLNSPLLEGDTIEEKDNGIYHVHRSNAIPINSLLTSSPSLNIYSGNSGFTYLNILNNKYTHKLNTECKCDVIKSYDIVSTSTSTETRISSKLGNSNQWRILNNALTTVDEYINWINSLNSTIIYELTEPTYELIEQSNLAIPSYANGHLDFNTAVPVEKVEFKPFTEELTYLYANTQYTVQFISTRAILADLILGGTSLLSQSIVKGLNRISITTPSELVDNKLTINGNDTGANISKVVVTDTNREFGYFEGMKSVGECEELEITSSNSDNSLSNTQQLTHEPLRGVGETKDRYVLLNGNWYIERKCGIRAYQEGDKDNYKTDLINTVYPLEMATYEEIDYNPFEVYTGTTHISTNSAVPTNITVKNHGFNCLLKPSTTYTISSNLGLNTVTTPSTLTEDCLRFMDTDTSDVTTMKNVLVLEGDWTTKPNLIPANFSGIESAFEQEYDAEKGKYKVNVKIANEDKSKENNITFYINEPLRGIGDIKDRIYVKDDKVVVQRNCGIRAYEDGDFGTYLTDKIDTVYPLAEPTYEEVEYNDTKLFIESFKNSTLFYNSNIPVTSKVHYSYSVPIVDTVAQTASISDEQDLLLVNMATEIAIMQLTL